MSTPAEDTGYPPPHHALRDLDFEVEAVAEGEHLARYLPAGQGAIELGGLLTVVDLLAGTLCIEAVAPDWMATSGLTFHTSGAVPVGPLDVTARLVRSGRTTVVLGAEVRAEDGGPVGEGVVTFSRLPRRDGNLRLDGATTEPGTRFSFDAGEPAPVGRGGSFADAIGCEVHDAAGGVTEMVVTPYVRNSFGAVNGGVVCTLAERAALAWGEQRTGAPVVVTDLAVHYLAQGREGPIRTQVREVRYGGGSTTCAVEVLDAGGPSPRPMVLAHVTLAPAGAV